MKTNSDKLVKYSLQGKPAHPIGAEIRVAADGRPFLVPAVGGITYNVSIGDSAFGLVGDHVEPGVSIKNENKAQNNALMAFSCLGNRARVVSGEAKGALGYVTGKHGGIDHVIVHFEEDARYQMSLDDSILVEGYGQGLALADHPDIFVQSLDPSILAVMEIKADGAVLIVPAVAEIPGFLMGSGIGVGNSYHGDYDLMTGDRAKIAELGLDKLRFGDFVLLTDCDNVYGRGYREGAVSLGVVVHSDCLASGHGPGIATVLSSQKPLLKMDRDENANLKHYFKKAQSAK